MTDESTPAGSAELANWHLIARGVKERLENCDGSWRSCSGCYETEDGQNVHGYPHSNVFGCALGGGCSECGGIGAVWDTTDYADMGETLAAEMHSGIPAQATQGCGDPSCKDPNCDYGKHDDALRSEVRSLRIDNARLRDEAAIRALAAQPPAVPVETLNEQAREHPRYDNPRDPFASPDRLPPRSSAGNADEAALEGQLFACEAELAKANAREKKLLAEKLQDKKDLYDYCVRAEEAEDEVKRLNALPQTLPDRASITRIINGIYGIGSGTYAGGHQDKSIARAVDAILAACSVTRPK